MYSLCTATQMESPGKTKNRHLKGIIEDEASVEMSCLAPSKSYNRTGTHPVIPSSSVVLRQLNNCMFDNGEETMHVAPDTGKFNVLKTIFRWKKSIYSMVWKTMLVFYILYVSISCVYIFALDAIGQQAFDDVSKYFASSSSSLNLTILLGFFTSRALQRFFLASNNVPGTTSITAIFIASLKTESKGFENGGSVVKDYARWVLLCWVLTARYVSKPFRKNGPTMKELIDKQILTEEENGVLKAGHIHLKNRPLVVIRWMLLLLNTCAENDHYRKDGAHQKNVGSLMKFKKDCGNMINKFAKRNMPLGLIQAAIIAVYYFYVICLMARNPLYEEHQQKIVNASASVCATDSEIPCKSDAVHLEDLTAGQIMMLFFPLTTLMQFFIFYSWLTFGRMAVTPFGEDESDISLERLYECHYRDYLWLVDTYSTAETLDYMFPSVHHFKKKRTSRASKHVKSVFSGNKRGTALETI